MKIAIYIQDGDTQIVLTPETKWEKSILSGIEEGQEEGQEEIKIMRGAFYETRGGWTRESDAPQSVILRLTQKPQDAENNSVA